MINTSKCDWCNAEKPDVHFNFRQLSTLSSPLYCQKCLADCAEEMRKEKREEEEHERKTFKILSALLHGRKGKA